MKMKYLLIAAVILLLPSMVLAVEPLPDVKNATLFEGSGYINGAAVPDGTCITASGGGGGTDCPGSEGGGTKNGIYSITVNYQGTPETITFSIKGLRADQTWQLKESDKGKRISLDLSVTTGVTGAPGGGGGGGGGITSAEPPENIECQETREEFLKADVPVTYRFTAACQPTGPVAYELVITASINAGTTSAKMEQLKNTSKLVTSSPPGIVYKNVNIWLGTSGFAVPRNIKEGIIRFRVDNNWFSRENVNANEVTMLRWNGRWDAVETEQVNKDANYTYYEAKSNTFSPFAISGKVPEMLPPTTAPPAVTPTPAPPELPGMLWLYALIIILVIAIGAYYLYAAAKKKEKK